MVDRPSAGSRRGVWAPSSAPGMALSPCLQRAKLTATHVLLAQLLQVGGQLVQRQSPQRAAVQLVAEERDGVASYVGRHRAGEADVTAGGAAVRVERVRGVSG